MKITDIRRMPAGPVMDALIAEFLFGYLVSRVHPEDPLVRPSEIYPWYHPRCYSTQGNNALQVFDWLVEWNEGDYTIDVRTRLGKRTCCVGEYDYGNMVVSVTHEYYAAAATADTLELAICRAGLLAAELDRRKKK